MQLVEEAEARGEALWTGDLVDEVRNKVVHAYRDLIGGSAPSMNSAVRNLLVRDLGMSTLNVGSTSWTQTDVETAIALGDVPLVLSVIEAACQCGLSIGTAVRFRVDAFIADVNRAFADHRCSYEVVSGQIIDIESKELHASVVAPALRLLSGLSGWEGVENAYQNALREIGDDPGDAITDAAAALQEALSLLGCDGNALGPLIASARSKGLLRPYDVKLSEWVSAARSDRGDAHKPSDAVADDAWLVVHVVGALILRLARTQA